MKAPKAKKTPSYEVLIRRAAVAKVEEGFGASADSVIDLILESYEVTWARVMTDIKAVEWTAATACEEGFEDKWIRTGKVPEEFA